MNRIVKILLLFILVYIPYFGATNASYVDSEKAFARMSASSLDMELQKTDGSRVEGNFFDVYKLENGKKVENEVKVVNSGETDFVYYPIYKFESGDALLCENIELEATHDGQKVFDGFLKDFDMASESAQISENTDTWKFEIEKDDTDTSLQGKTCEFDIEFMAFQNTDKTGFSDIETLENKIESAYEPIVTITYISDRQIATTISNLENFDFFTGDLEYIGDGKLQKVMRDFDLNGEGEITIYTDLGTESNGVFMYHDNPHDFVEKLNFVDNDGYIFNVEESL